MGRKKKEIEPGVANTANTGTTAPKTQEPEAPSSELMDVLRGVAGGIEKINTRLDDIEGRVSDMEDGGKNKFKDDAKPEDIAAAKGNRSRLDPKLVGIVDEMLGEDFGIEVNPRGDQPGFKFTLIVPQRLSDNVVDKRPKKDPENPGQYLKDVSGNVIFEDYVPEDRRSRIVSSTDSYDAIRSHCERVRSYIVSYFQKVNKPLPEFKVK